MNKRRPGVVIAPFRCWRGTVLSVAGTVPVSLRVSYQNHVRFLQE
jgi:hypothetical protein